VFALYQLAQHHQPRFMGEGLQQGGSFARLGGELIGSKVESHDAS
jgi:hypothetical protein